MLCLEAHSRAVPHSSCPQGKATGTAWLHERGGSPAAPRFAAREESHSQPHPAPTPCWGCSPPQGQCRALRAASTL